MALLMSAKPAAAAKEATWETYRPEPVLVSLNTSAPTFFVLSVNSASPNLRQLKSKAWVQRGSLGFWAKAFGAGAKAKRVSKSPQETWKNRRAMRSLVGSCRNTGKFTIY